MDRVFDVCNVPMLDAFSPGSESKAGVSWEAGVAGRDELGLRRRSCWVVGHIRSRIHVSLYKSSPTVLKMDHQFHILGKKQMLASYICCFVNICCFI